MTELINNLFGKRAFIYFPIEAKGRMESHDGRYIWNSRRY
jgi:hypothetical protein